jgi:hypothetical protein
VLRDKWSLAFPLNNQDVRPLAIGSTRDIAAAMSWSLPYTLGVLSTWKMAPVYCEAVLRHDQRIDLDGAHEASELYEAEEVLGVVFPTDEDVSLPLNPSKEALMS